MIDGIVVLGKPRDPDSYPKDLHAVLAQSERTHFWFDTRNRIIVSTIQRHLENISGKLALDIGCGNGVVAAALEQSGMRLCGVDMNLAGLQHAREQVKAPLICLDAFELPFQSTFDVALLCDVIEHVEDDIGMLRNAASVLNHDGLMLITVPAMPHLWTPIDDASGHKRRYSRNSLIKLLQEAGLRVRQVRYFNALLVPLLLLRRFTVPKSTVVMDEAHRLRVVRSALLTPPAPVNQLLRLLTRLEMGFDAVSFPFGGSLIAVAERAT